jgi:hypothetical protein
MNYSFSTNIKEYLTIVHILNVYTDDKILWSPRNIRWIMYLNIV